MGCGQMFVFEFLTVLLFSLIEKCEIFIFIQVYSYSLYVLELWLYCYYLDDGWASDFIIIRTWWRGGILCVQ